MKKLSRLPQAASAAKEPILGPGTASRVLLHREEATQ